MSKRFFQLIFLGFISSAATAQSGDLMIMGVSPDLYLLHTVTPKENWYSVGRLYNISPKEIAPFNAATIENPLSIGQQLKVPLTTGNFSQDGTKAGDEAVVPVYHIVQEKEWMFRISTNYNKVPVENLEKWNNVSKDQAKAGMKLIVGYLKVKNELSALASKGVSNVKAGTPPANAPVTTSTSTPVAAEPVAKQDGKDEKQTPPAENKAIVTNPVTQPIPVQPPVTQPATNNTASNGAGYFKTLFAGSGKSVSGSAGVFKSTSGWQDGKYYALINNVAVGTIVKVSNPTNNKTVFAKVLGQLPDMKESVGLTARVSDAAASELGTTATRFSVEVKY